MGADEMSDLPPLPTGFQIDAAPQAPAVPPLPDGFQVDSPNIAMDMLKSGGVGLGEGAIGLAGMPGDIGSLASAATDKVGSMFGASPQGIQSFKNAASNAMQMIPGMAPFADGPTSAKIQSAVEAGTGPFYQPQTDAGKYAQTVGQFAPAVLGGEGSLASRLLTRAVIPGVASQGAQQMAQGTGLEGVAGIAGALTGAMGAQP